MTWRLALAALMLVFGTPLWAAADPARYMSAELIAETLSPAPGSTTLVGFKMIPQPGWHGYWSNPGDSGIAPSVRWTAPRGVTFGPLLHPAPTLLTAQGISSFVHGGPHVLLSRMTISRSIPAGTAIPIVADFSWAACTATQCVPLHAKFELRLTPGKGERAAESAALRAAIAKLPRAAPNGTFVRTGKELRLQFPSSLKLDARKARFFPADAGTFDTAGARADRVDGRLVISAAANADTPASLSGVVSDGQSAYRLKLVETHQTLPTSAAKSPQFVEQRSTAPSQAIPSPDRTAQPRPTEPVAGRPWMWAVLAAAAAIGAAAFMLARRRS